MVFVVQSYRQYLLNRHLTPKTDHDSHKHFGSMIDYKFQEEMVR